MQPDKNCKKLFAIALIFLFINASCGSNQFKYLSLAPVEPGSRSAYDDYESIKEADVEIIMARSLPELTLEKIKGEKNNDEYQAFRKILRIIDKAGYTLFSLKVVNKQNRKVAIDSENLTMEYLGELVEKELKPLDEKDFYNLKKLYKLPDSKNLDSYFLNSIKHLETKNDVEVFIVFPYKIKDEHLTKILFRNISIDDKEYDFEYLFYSADRLEKTKRVCIYGGVGAGVIAIIVGVVAFFTK